MARTDTQFSLRLPIDLMTWLNDYVETENEKAGGKVVNRNEFVVGLIRVARRRTQPIQGNKSGYEPE